MIIYRTINLVNGKIYIGQDYYNNPQYLGSGILLERAIIKYGKENFRKEILEKCISKNDLDLKEIYWIQKLDSTNKEIGYNISSGGSGGNTISNHPKNTEFRKFLSERNKEFYKEKSNHPMFGKIQTPESNEKRRNSILGIKRSKETRNKQSKSALGKNNSAYGKIWIHNKKIIKNKLIDPNEYQNYLKNGWEKGMILNNNNYDG